MGHNAGSQPSAVAMVQSTEDPLALSRYYLPVYRQRQVVLERGEGSRLWDSEGRDYVDLAAGIAVCSLGHADPDLTAALVDQAGRLWHTSNVFHSEPPLRLAQELVQASRFASRVFLCNSGAEANEAAIKWARAATGRNRFVALKNGFSGRSGGVLPLTWEPKYREPFAPYGSEVEFVAMGDEAALTAAVDDRTAGVLLEPIQGESGIRPVPAEFLQLIRRLTREHGALLILDEIQTGVGRTGTFFAHEQAGVTPDIMGIAKGLGGGFPIGACLATERVAEHMTAGTHGSTFGGNPLATSVANAVLDVITAPGFFDELRRNGGQLQDGLAGIIADYPNVVQEQSGLGLMIGLKCAVNNGDFISALREQRMLAVKAGNNTIRLLPPLNVSSDEISQALTLLRRVCASWQS